MAFCPHCGTQLPDGADFCPSCGRPVSDTAAAGGPSPPGGAPPPSVPPSDYPVQFDVDYPDRPLSRVSTFFRIFAAIPILILAALLSGESSFQYSGDTSTSSAAAGGGVLFLPVLLMLLFRRKYPGWWFNWNLEFTRFGARIGAYLALLDDRYPSTDEEQSVHLEIERPDGPELSRGLPLVKWLLAIPHWFILLFLWFAAFWVVVFAWFAILFTGRYPRGAFEFVVGVYRWWLRVAAYALLLTTDRYPPFRLGP
ncbi:MAG: hypothetical protein QOJ13_660 [Gaiellales bacterium]|nr:hypothetical protein [Gaiellales bacterium]